MSFVSMIMAFSLVIGSLPNVIAADLAPPSYTAQGNYAQKAQAQLDALTRGLHAAERKLPHLGTAARSECEEMLKRLWRKERLARVNLEAIRRAPVDHWQTLRPKEDVLLIRLQKSYQHLINHYFNQGT